MRLQEAPTYVIWSPSPQSRVKTLYHQGRWLGVQQSPSPQSRVKTHTIVVKPEGARVAVPSKSGQNSYVPCPMASSPSSPSPQSRVKTGALDGTKPVVKTVAVPSKSGQNEREYSVGDVVKQVAVPSKSGQNSYVPCPMASSPSSPSPQSRVKTPSRQSGLLVESRFAVPSKSGQNKCTTSTLRVDILVAVPSKSGQNIHRRCIGSPR